MTTEKDVEALEERVRKLAGEKSSLELVISLMNRMSEASGLENTIENMLRTVQIHTRHSADTRGMTMPPLLDCRPTPVYLVRYPNHRIFHFDRIFACD